MKRIYNFLWHYGLVGKINRNHYTRTGVDIDRDYRRAMILGFVSIVVACVSMGFVVGMLLG